MMTIDMLSKCHVLPQRKYHRRSGVRLFFSYTPLLTQFRSLSIVPPQRSFFAVLLHHGPLHNHNRPVVLSGGNDTEANNIFQQTLDICLLQLQLQLQWYWSLKLKLGVY